MLVGQSSGYRCTAIQCLSGGGHLAHESSVFCLEAKLPNMLLDLTLRHRFEMNPLIRSEDLEPADSDRNDATQHCD